MPRPLWKGAISFGMVTIPIKLYTATEEKDVHFNMLHAEDMSRIKQKRFCAEEDVEVSNDEIVKGYEITPGHYVALDDEDFAKVPVITTRTIDIQEFVSLDQIDPIYYQKTYFLEPEEVGLKPFALLMKTLEETERVAIAKVAMRQKEQLCTLRIREGTIVLETMFYADEVRSAKDLVVPGDDIKVNDKELAMAKMLVDTMTSDDLDLDQYKDDYREALLGIIKAKSEGQEIEEVPEAKPAKITDLSEALRASVEAIRKNRDAGKKEAEPASHRRARAKAS
jgi:DNA end-binding protein Ku